VEGEVLALVINGESVQSASLDDQVQIILPKTGFYIEAGGQVDDTGFIRGTDWEIEVTGMRRASAGVIVHNGEVISGQPKVGDKAVAEVDMTRRHDIMRNHTATHLLHKALHAVLSDQANQAGSLVAPDRLRFDFNYPEAMTPEQIDRVEKMVNDAIASDMPVQKQTKSLDEAKKEGAMALFGEKYGETVRTISILESDSSTVGHKYSYELCGGTHLERTSDIGAFLIVNEGSVASNVRRIEAVTGRGAYDLVHKRFKTLKQTAGALSTSVDEVPVKVDALQNEIDTLKKENAALRQKIAFSSFNVDTIKVEMVADNVPVFATQVPGADMDALRLMGDQFTQKYTGGTAIFSTDDGKVIAVAGSDLVKRGFKAGDLITGIGGKGGGRPNMAQGSLPGENVSEALSKVAKVVEEKIK
jgi:alanyl-tRNA synthetase